jgi:hypothetical protein
MLITTVAAAATLLGKFAASKLVENKNKRPCVRERVCLGKEGKDDAKDDDAVDEGRKQAAYSVRRADRPVAARGCL